jgi:hypothetical protein
MQQAWINAQPRLAQLRDSFNPYSSPHPPIVRVGQLDAELLDHDFLHLLQDHLKRALVNVCSTL